MEVTLKELSGMLQQFQRAATSTRAKCQANQEEGYDIRRAGDVGHADGRLTAITVMQSKLNQLVGPVIEADAFLTSFAAEAHDAEMGLKVASSEVFYSLMGQYEAYTDVISAVEAWEHLPHLVQ